MNSTPFTASQWQELEHQALIFKYMMAGIPVPQELLAPIRRSFEAMASRFYHHPALGYCSLYGKKLDPEPGRCRRTDGKKWRCSKDAYPDSKYCERHMHRGRNRSRKPVETQQTLLSQSHSSSSSSSSTATATATLAPSVATAGTGSFQGFPISSLAGATGIRSGLSQLQLETGSYGVATRDFRNPYVTKAGADEHSFFSEASGSAKGVAMDSSLDNTWSLMPSQVSAFPISKERNGSLLQSNYPQIDYHLQDLGQVTISSLPKPQQQQQQHSFFGSEFGSTEPVKHESQSLRPFFDEWPKTRDLWSDLEDDRSNRTSFSTTQLSISIPRASPDFSNTSSRSPNHN